MAGPKIGCPAMKQPTFDWDTEDEYSKLKTFRLEVNNILSTYNTPQIDKLALVKKWWGRKDLQYLETLTTTEKETCNTLEGLSDMLTNKFKPQYNETIRSLQFRKLCRYEDENVEEWMGRLWVAVVECNYQEINRQLKEQFIHGLNDKSMLEEIIKELTTARNDDRITSGGVLAWAKRVEVQRVQVAVLSRITESRQFDKLKVSIKEKESKTKPPMQQNSTSQQPCRYCGRIDLPKQCPAYGKTCMACKKMDISTECARVGRAG